MVVSSQEKEQEVVVFPTTSRIASPGKRSILPGETDPATDNIQFCSVHKTRVDPSRVTLLVC